MRNEIESIDKKLIENKEKYRFENEKKIIHKIKEDPSTFYRFARKKSKAKSEIGPLRYKKGVTSDERTMAQILMEQYRDVCSIPFRDIRDKKFHDEIFKNDNDYLNKTWNGYDNDKMI